MSRLAPDALPVFEALMLQQPAVYSTHARWVEDHTPEQVRFAMLETRRQGIGTLDHFNNALTTVKGRLSK